MHGPTDTRTRGHEDSRATWQGVQAGMCLVPGSIDHLHDVLMPLYSNIDVYLLAYLVLACREQVSLIFHGSILLGLASSLTCTS